MKRTAIAFLSLLATQTIFAEGVKGKGDWMMFYYKNPAPEQLVAEVRAMTKAGALKDPNAQPPTVAFLSRVMAKNPTKINKWLEELGDLEKNERSVVFAAAWYSDTDEARAFFKKKGLQDYLDQEAPAILEMEVKDPSTLDMLWGYFMATGDEAPIRRIISAFALSKHAGAVERFKDSAKTEEDRKAAYFDATFQSAQWSLESNCRQHPLVLKHAEAIFADPKLPKDQSLWLGVVLSKVKPEKYHVKIGEDDGKEKGKGDKKVAKPAKPSR